MKIADSPGALLVLTGSLLGLTFPLGKLATNAGISPVVWAWLISAGSALCLFVICLILGRSMKLDRSVLRYFLILGPISLAIPNVLTFLVIPKLGSGYTGLMFTLSPVFTLALSALWQVRVPSALGICGIVLGFVGAFTVALTRGELGQPASFIWVVFALCIPISLSLGNLYRTMAWPPGAHPLPLAAGTNTASALMLLCVIVFADNATLPGGLIEHANVSIPAVLAATAMFTVFFRLQQVGGPTYLSQIGYVAAAVALICGTWFLNERYSVITWAGALIILVGVLVSVRAQKAATR